jgi:hypothetical protein
VRCSQFLWIRYADWAFTTPLLLIDLGLLAGITWPEMVFIGENHPQRPARLLAAALAPPQCC